MSRPTVKALPRDGAAVQLWQAPAVDDGRGPAADKLLTADRLAAIEEQARQAGRAAGFEEGRRLGIEAGREEMLKTAAQLTALFDGISPQLKVLDEALMEQLCELVLAVARQFVRRELRSQPGEVLRVVREALAALPASDARVRVYLHPEDAALAREALPPDAQERPLQILEDIALSRGGARLETDASLVDASVESRLSSIAARLLGDERRGAEQETLDRG